jgi:hypothetical protein
MYIDNKGKMVIVENISGVDINVETRVARESAAGFSKKRIPL